MAQHSMMTSLNISVPVLDVAEAQVEADGLGQQGQQRSLLQLEGLQRSTVHSAKTVTDLIPDPDQEAMNAMILAINQQLSKDCRPLGMDCRVGDPVLLGHCGRKGACVRPPALQKDSS
ncbi:MAG: hypothetical protein FRX49_09690 [Trebouxia sp. A1-2]|nr:MAG: hypothetical protein FRX49_09690 [Trebouxia sp. A1-2]